MAKSIGTLGRARPPLDLEFSYFDQTIRVHPQATDSVEIEFLEAGRDIDMDELAAIDFNKIEEMSEEDRLRLIRTMGKAQQAGYHAMMASLRRLIHPDDFKTYWDVGVLHGQTVRDRMADIRSLTAAVAEATTDFPTGRPSDSPPGPSPTPPSSAAVSPSPDAHPEDLRVAMALERGRPDLQEFYVMVAEQRQQEQEAVRLAAERDARKLREAGIA